MATVYLAEDLKHRRQVAIKVLRPDLAAALGPERFMQEIEIAARLQHPHILGVHDSGSADGFLYSGCSPKSPMPSATPTAAAWCIATSSPRTSWFRAATRW